MAYRLTEEQIRTVVDRASRSLANYCIATNLHYVVTGSSGGLDSAITLGLAERACQFAETQDFNLTSLALILPCESDPEDVKKGLAAAENFGATILMVPIESVFKCFMSEIAIPLNDNIAAILRGTGGEKILANWDWFQKIAQGNIKARLRMITLYHTAKMLNGMVLSTDNLSEFYMAFWTICGDVGDFNMIQNILKGRELYDIARYLKKVPEEIIQSKPGDGLKVAGSAEDQLGADYWTIDTIMIQLIQQGFDPNGSFAQLDKLPNIDGINPLIVQKIAGRCLAGQYKRHGTITISREELGLPAIKEIQL